MEEEPLDESSARFAELTLAAISAVLVLIGERPPYRGRLSPKKVAEGMNASARNASRLAEDAGILLEAKRYPSATSLAILAIEEAGKLPILRALAVAKTDEALKDGWKSYRSHQTKNVMWLFPLFVLSGVRNLEGFRALFDPNSEHRERLDELKQAGFYTDCLGKGVWALPDDLIDEMIAKFIVKTARSLTKEHVFSEREIELWIEHVGPSLERASAQNLKRFWDAMVEEGLAAVKVDNVDEFLGLTPKAG
jgi:AbiV family abortive infection protein